MLYSGRIYSFFPLPQYCGYSKRHIDQISDRFAEYGRCHPEEPRWYSPSTSGCRLQVYSGALYRSPTVSGSGQRQQLPRWVTVWPARDRHGPKSEEGLLQGPHLYLPFLLNNKLEYGPMPNVMAALSNIGGALCSTPQNMADAHCWSTVQ